MIINDEIKHIQIKVVARMKIKIRQIIFGKSLRRKLYCRIAAGCRTTLSAGNIGPRSVNKAQPQISLLALQI